MAHASMQLAYTCWPACVAAGIAPARITRTIANHIKAAATRYVVNEPVSSSDCHRTMTRSREPCLCRHTPLVTRTGANEYALLLISCPSHNVLPTCGRRPLPSLSLWPGRQPYRPRLVGGRRGGGPSSVAPRSRNPPTGHRRDSPISSLLFSHGQPLCAVG